MSECVYLNERVKLEFAADSDVLIFWQSLQLITSEAFILELEALTDGNRFRDGRNRRSKSIRKRLHFRYVLRLYPSIIIASKRGVNTIYTLRSKLSEMAVVAVHKRLLISAVMYSRQTTTYLSFLLILITVFQSLVRNIVLLSFYEISQQIVNNKLIKVVIILTTRFCFS